jgi:signal transduction histidine kinase
VQDQRPDKEPDEGRASGVEPPRGRASRVLSLFDRLGLSGKLLLLTIVFVMVSEVLIFVPSIANFRLTWLNDRVASAQTAALVLDAAPYTLVPKALEEDLLASVGAMAIASKHQGIRRLMMVHDQLPPVAAHIDVREPPGFNSIFEAFETLFAGDGRTIRVIGEDRVGDDGFIELVIDETPLRHAMFTYSTNILSLSLIISAITAALVYFTLNWLLVRPMRRITGAMIRFRQDPEDAKRVIAPSGRSDEVGRAESELAAMQRELAETLQQKARLAALGLAVSKINHDLRNILATAHLISDRLAAVSDPTVQRFAPKLIASLDRAIALCSDTIRYGRAREAPPQRASIGLAALAEQAAESAGLAGHDGIEWINTVDPSLKVDADPDQFFRVLMNLMRNSVQALESSPHSHTDRDSVRLSARRDGAVVTIEICDTGPGVPPKARENLFTAFKGSARAGGSGLGLAITAEIVRGHGGTIRLLDQALGAAFQIVLPDQVVELNARRGEARAG